MDVFPLFNNLGKFSGNGDSGTRCVMAGVAEKAPTGYLKIH
jgi:hypothetical protein